MFFLVRFLKKRHLARNDSSALITRQFHCGSANRLGKHVETDSARNSLAHRLQVDNGGIKVASAPWPNVVTGDPFRAHRIDMRWFVLIGDQFDKTDTLGAHHRFSYV